MPDRATLRQFQALPLTAKITMSKNRIYAWYEHFDGKVCVSFSGGKDSTVLAHLVHSIFPEVPLVFANTGLEYPEIQAFAKKMGAEFVRPKMSFSEVISTYGYPIISKENAEAIYYARRIKNGGGVLNTERPAESGTNWLENDTTETCRTVRNQTNRGGVLPNQTNVRRNLLTGGNGNLGRRGKSGEEEPSPG